jgi:hypothetical protein
LHDAAHYSVGGFLFGQIDAAIEVNAHGLPGRRRRGEIDGRDGTAISGQSRSNRLT